MCENLHFLFRFDTAFVRSILLAQSPPSFENTFVNFSSSIPLKLFAQTPTQHPNSLLTGLLFSLTSQVDSNRSKFAFLENIIFKSCTILSSGNETGVFLVLHICTTSWVRVSSRFTGGGNCKKTPSTSALENTWERRRNSGAPSAR